MDASKLIGYDGIFVTRLRDLMKSAKATQQDVAAAVGTTRQAISQYADGSVQPNIEKLYKIAEYFNVSADYLLGFADVTASDVDDKAINKMLGLSEKAIAALKAAPSAATVNLLLEQTSNADGTVLQLLQEIFDYTKEEEPGVVFGLIRFKLGDGDKTQSSLVEGQAAALTDSDVFAVRMLKLQQAIAQYKTEIEDKKANGGKQ